LGVRRAWWAAAIFTAVLLAYGPVWRAGFVWDDDRHVTAPELRAADGLGRIWFELGATQQYYPLLHSAFWLEHRLWRSTPLPYHLLNLSLHALAAFLFALVLHRLALPGAFVAGMIFALHPVCVESVAWVSEQKNTLSTVLYLGAALAYLRFDATRSLARYLVASGLFVAALMTKTVTATLPAILLVIFWWQGRRLAWRRDVLPLLPWLLLGAGAGLLTAWVERRFIGAEGAPYELSILQRGLLAGRIVWFYLGKLFWPTHLAFIYPRWTVDPSVPWQWLPPLGLVALLGGLVAGGRRTRPALAALCCFIGSLFPALGFFNVFPFLYSFVADHFQYLASLAIIALVPAMLAWLTARREGSSTVVTIGLLLVLGTLTWRQSRVYRDSETLFRATLRENPACWMAENNLGHQMMQDRSRLLEAIGRFERALALRPIYYEAENNLGFALTEAGRPDEALPRLDAALRLKPDSVETFNNLGIAYAKAGRMEQSIEAFRHGVRLNPELAVSHDNLGKALRMAGRGDEADEESSRAARLRAADGAPRE
jgi:protein O-mannosyl-transferase